MFINLAIIHQIHHLSISICSAYFPVFPLGIIVDQQFPSRIATQINQSYFVPVKSPFSGIFYGCPKVNIQKKVQNHGFPFGKWSTNGGFFTSIFQRLQEVEIPILFQFMTFPLSNVYCVHKITTNFPNLVNISQRGAHGGPHGSEPREGFAELFFQLQLQLLERKKNKKVDLSGESMGILMV